MRSPSHGTGRSTARSCSRCPDSVVLEPGVLVFHPENVSLDEDVYVGHYAILKGYYKNELRVGAGELDRPGRLPPRGRRASPSAARRHRAARVHPDLDARRAAGRGRAIMDGPIDFAPVVLEDGCDIGIGAIILPGVTVGRGAQVGAGAVVTHVSRLTPSAVTPHGRCAVGAADYGPGPGSGWSYRKKDPQ